MKQKLKRLLKRRKVSSDDEATTRFREAVETLPKITSETVAAHREEVLGSARKYIYPLEHSKHRIVIISSTLLLAAAVAFSTYCMLALYRFQTSSVFVYRITQVIPFPIAKAGPNYVAYENYLFELRRYQHYYQSQQAINFTTQKDRLQLNAFKKQALQQVIDDAFVKQLAAQHGLTVTDQEVDDEVTLVRNQDRLGSSDKVFADVLKEFWGWSIDDFKRELKQELLAQKVVSALDTATHQRAQSALTQLQQGTDFATLAGQISDDTTTKANGGQFGFTIDKSNQNLPPQTVNALLSLKPGQISGIINIGQGLEIDKVISSDGGKVQAAHILFKFQDIRTYLEPFEAKSKTHTYIKV